MLATLHESGRFLSVSLAGVTEVDKRKLPSDSAGLQYFCFPNHHRLIML